MFIYLQKCPFNFSAAGDPLDHLLHSHEKEMSRKEDREDCAKDKTSEFTIGRQKFVSTAFDSK